MVLALWIPGLTIGLWAQSDGEAQIRQLVAQAKAAAAAGQTDRALELAGTAAAQARRAGLMELRAAALNAEGHLLMSSGKARRAANSFEQSIAALRNVSSPDQELLRDNIAALHTLAAQGDVRQRELQRLENEVAAVSGQPPAPDFPATPEEPLSRSEMREAIVELTQKIGQMQQQGGSGGAKTAESQALRAQLAAREEVINRMSEEQAKNQLILTHQQMTLDSLVFRREVDSLAYSNTELALQKAEGERNLTYSLLAIAMLLAAGVTVVWLRTRQHARLLAEKNNIIQEERKRSEDLLLNILPALIADELKQQGHADARFYDDVSVLFADFVGFSNIAEKLSPQQLVSELDTCFKAFDEIVARHGLEKIKTIGDAYMCAGGLPNGGGSRTRDMVQAALEMQAWLVQWNEGQRKTGLPVYEARIGIHRGPVVAGVVGSRKFAFDIWGDTVNIASRVESAGEGGKINISGEVYRLIKNEFNCDYRGKIPAKNKGEIDMYFVQN